MRKGFTLVEMLVAVVLITLLIGVALFAFRLQIISITKAKKTSIEPVIIYENIHASLESIQYYVVDQYDMLNQPMNQLHYFFDGDPIKMIYISENPILHNGIVVSELICKDKKLLYYEEPLYKFIDYLRPEIPQTNDPLILYTGLDECSFSYKTIRGQKVQSLKKEVPLKIFLHLKKNKKDISIISQVYNDFNTSIFPIKDMINE